MKSAECNNTPNKQGRFPTYVTTHVPKGGFWWKREHLANKKFHFNLLIDKNKANCVGMSQAQLNWSNQSPMFVHSKVRNLASHALRAWEFSVDVISVTLNTDNNLSALWFVVINHILISVITVAQDERNANCRLSKPWRFGKENEQSFLWNSEDDWSSSFWLITSPLHSGGLVGNFRRTWALRCNFVVLDARAS